MHPQQTKSPLVRTLFLRAAAAGAIFCAWYYAAAWAANAPPPQIQFPGQVINPNINRAPINPAPRNPNQQNPNQQNPNQPAPNQAPANNANQAPAGQTGGGIRTATITFTGTGAALTGAPAGGAGVS